jgi:tRNA(Ile)-lysidine synthase
LWHAAARAAAAQGLEVVALHVHHGLQPAADAWLGHLRAQARRWAARGLPVRLVWRRLEGRPAKGESLEAWARRERYAALTEMARGEGIDLVLLAHHRRDQAETFLLQALRGAGPAGLASMPRMAQRGGITWARPWLDLPRECIEAYVRRHRLAPVEDPSNADRRRTRNALRHAVWPALVSQLPHAEAHLAAAARRAHEAAVCLAELAALDGRQACNADGSLALAPWLQLSPPRRANLLRTWLNTSVAGGVPETLIARLTEELPSAQQGAWPLHDGWLRLHRGRLRIVGDDAGVEVDAPAALRIDLSRHGRHEVQSWQGAFEVRAVAHGGLAAARLRDACLRHRQGGERFQGAPQGVPRSLKKQYQAAGVPSWERGGPLVYAGDALLYVPGLGIDARQVAAPDTPMRELRWLPATAG